MKNKAIKDAMNSIENRIHHVYNQGYEDGLKDGKESVQIDETEAYKLGLETAWELARKLSNLGFNDTRKEIFGEKYGLSIDIIKDFSVDEVAAKIKEHEEKQKRNCDTCQYLHGGFNSLKICANCYGNSGWTPKQAEDGEIKIGDEVILDRKCSYVSNVRGVVIACNSCSDRPYKIMLGEGYSKWMKADSIDRKTGRTFPQIEEVLEQLKGEEG